LQHDFWVGVVQQLDERGNCFGRAQTSDGGGEFASHKGRLLLRESLAIKRQQRRVLQSRQRLDRLRPYLVVEVGRKAHQGRRVEIGRQPSQQFKRLQQRLDPARFVERALKKARSARAFACSIAARASIARNHTPSAGASGTILRACERGVWRRALC